MINFTNNLIIQGERGTARITRWETWFSTPFGVTPDLHQAILRCTESDFDPEVTIRPVAVAFGLTGDGGRELSEVKDGV